MRVLVFFSVTVVVHEATHFTVAWILGGKPRLVGLQTTIGVNLQREFEQGWKYRLFLLSPMVTVGLALQLVTFVIFNDTSEVAMVYVPATIAIFASLGDMKKYIGLRHQHA